HHRLNTTNHRPGGSRFDRPNWVRIKPPSTTPTTTIRPTYARLRAMGAVHQVALPDGSPVWLVTTEAEGRAGLANPVLSVNKDHAGSGYKGFSLPPALDAKLLNIDAQDHLRLRRLVSKEFTPRRVENLGSTVRHTCELLARGLIDRVKSRGAADLVAGLAAPLPLTVVGDLLGVPDQDRGPFASWMTRTVRPISRTGTE
ncbi:cytochrome P450, partial [Streptomyces sp. Je 1-79]|nr:cytochrome P450 [Streptomyces sp. Je 1-79]